MKSQSFQKTLLALAGILIFSAASGWTQNVSGVTGAPNQPAPGAAVAPSLSYGVPQILQLAQAKIGDDTIVAFIKNSGTIYNLDAPQIVYLKQQGVSETVLNAMLSQRQNVMAAAQNAPSAATTSQPSATTYVQPAAASVPTSTVYVVPDSSSYYYYNNYYQPYYYPYYYPYYVYTPVVFSFGFGHGFHGRPFYGGFHGGFHGSFPHH